MLMKIYKHIHVKQVQDFYGDLLRDFSSSFTVKEHLLYLAERLWEGIENQNKVAGIELSNYHPQYLGKKWEEISQDGLNKADAFQCIAAEYGFGRWEDVEELDDTNYHQEFELLVDLVLNGNIREVESLISKRPDLLQLKSSYGHQASILHYCASNGLELWRQQVPENLAAISKLLIEKGADKQAKMKVYGGEFTALPLLESSAHPREAGILEEMQAILA